MSKKIHEQEEFLLLKKRNDEFLASLLHDIKSPMMSINIALSQKLHNELLRDIYKINLFNLNFIDNLLCSYNFENATASIKLKPVSLSQLLNEQLGVYKYLLKEKKLETIVSGFKGLPAINSCPTCIGRVFSNLISNAQKYALEESKICIKALVRDAVIVLEFTNIAQSCEENFCEDIFDKFYTENPHSSKGLGLHICKKVLQELGGKIWVESASEKVTFYVELVNT